MFHFKSNALSILIFLSLKSSLLVAASPEWPVNPNQKAQAYLLIDQGLKLQDLAEKLSQCDVLKNELDTQSLSLCGEIASTDTQTMDLVKEALPQFTSPDTLTTYLARITLKFSILTSKIQRLKKIEQSNSNRIVQDWLTSLSNTLQSSN